MSAFSSAAFSVAAFSPQAFSFDVVQQELYGAGDDSSQKRKGKSYLDLMYEVQDEALAARQEAAEEAERIAALRAEPVLQVIEQPVIPSFTETPITLLSAELEQFEAGTDAEQSADITPAFAELKRRRILAAYVAIKYLH